MSGPRPTWIAGVLGAAAGLGFLVRWALLGDVDGRGFALALLGGALLALFAWLDDEDAPLLPTGSARLRHAWSVGLVALAGLAGFAAYVGVTGIDRPWDLSARGAFRLGEDSRRLLAHLPRPVEVHGVFVRGTDRARAWDRMAVALTDAAPTLTVTTVDPRREPLMAHALEVQDEAGQVVIQAGGHTERLTDRLDEAAVVNAILRASGGETFIVCAATGQGEAGLDDDRAGDAYSALVLGLEGRSFQWRAVAPLQGPVDPDCDVLVAARPVEDWSPASRAALDDWVLTGGAAMVLLEPGIAPALTGHLDRYGLELPDGVVLDASPDRRMAAVGDASVLVLPRAAWVGHPVADGLAGAVVMPLARPVRPRDGTPGMSWHALAFTSREAWLETGGGVDPKPDPGEPAGELPLLAAGEVIDPAAIDAEVPAADRRPGGRLVVLGDASFADNTFVDLGSNRELFGNALAWLLDEAAPVARVPEPSGAIELTQGELVAVAALAWLAFPGLAAVLALQRWVAARRG